MRTMTRELEEFLDGYTPAVRALALRARELILKSLPDATETVWPGWRMIGYGTGPGMPEMVYGIGPLKNRINLTFGNGSMLADPHGLLKGTGKVSRHVHVATIDELESLPVRGLIKQALAVHVDERNGRQASAQPPRARSSKPAAVRLAAVRPADEVSPVSDMTVKEKTGKSWSEWFRVLDRAGAQNMKHAEIVKVLADHHGVGPWWRQMLTVGYERARGLRDRHETTAGYQVGASKTINVPVETLWAAWQDARRRRPWLGNVQLTVRKATEPKSMRITWDDGSHIDVLFQVKGDAKSSVSVDHRKLPDRAHVEAMKTFWRARLGALKERLER